MQTSSLNPKSMKEIGSFQNARGQKLYSVIHTPDNGVPPASVLVFHHGLGEYIDRFDHGGKTLDGPRIPCFSSANNLQAPARNSVNLCPCTVFALLAEGGIAVYAFDAHGHGLSEPKDDKVRCYFEHFEDLTDDSWQFIKDVVVPLSTGLPIFCGGNSLGGLVATYIVARHQSVFAGLVLNSAAIDVIWTPLLKCACHCTATCVASLQHG